MSDTDFQGMWAEWVQHRKEIRKTLTPSTIKTQLKKMGKMGKARSTAMMQHTIANGWTGLYESDAKTTAAPDALVTSTNPDDWKME
jgi:hypothetical protein